MQIEIQKPDNMNVHTVASKLFECNAFILSSIGNTFKIKVQEKDIEAVKNSGFEIIEYVE